jgi:hypothetical protein
MTRSVNRGDAVAESTQGPPPALFTTTSRRPWRLTTVSTSAVTWSASRTSQATKSTPSAAPSGGVRAHTTTLAPASA